jgi:hypothetical protein
MGPAWISPHADELRPIRHPETISRKGRFEQKKARQAKRKGLI